MYLRNTFLYMIGLGFLALAKTKHRLQGYTTPKPFDLSETDRCIEYDIGVVEHWLSHLNTYTQGAFSLEGRNVLELGPGSDLGIGLYLLAKGCHQYNACDVNNLVQSAPDSFYEQLFRTMESAGKRTDTGFLREQLKQTKGGKPSRLNYVVRDDFDLVSAFGESKVDLVLSQAAFEHFDDIEATIARLSAVCKPGALLAVEIDLMTHSRWIREKDPNNIYRYQDSVYRAFHFRGIPNRVRPFQYKAAFESCGWTDISITPLQKLDDPSSSYSGMSRNFSDRKNQMDYLSIMLCARKTA